MHVRGARKEADLVGHLLTKLVALVYIAAGEFHVNGSGDTEVQYLAHDVRRLEEELGAREVDSQFLTQLSHEVLGWRFVVRLKADKNLGIGSADCAVVAVRHVQTAVWEPDIIEHIGQLTRRDHLTDELIDLIALARRFLDAEAHSRAHVQANQSRVDAGEEIAPQDENERP